MFLFPRKTVYTSSITSENFGRKNNFVGQSAVLFICLLRRNLNNQLFSARAYHRRQAEFSNNVEPKTPLILTLLLT